jgi:hypothetical protein
MTLFAGVATLAISRMVGNNSFTSARLCLVAPNTELSVDWGKTNV